MCEFVKPEHTFTFQASAGPNSIVNYYGLYKIKECNFNITLCKSIFTDIKIWIYMYKTFKSKYHILTSHEYILYAVLYVLEIRI